MRFVGCCKGGADNFRRLGHDGEPYELVASVGGLDMRNFDLSPLMRSTVGFDHLSRLVDSALTNDSASAYPPYNIEVLGENQYAITLSVAGFNQSELDINVEKNVLTVRGKKAQREEKQYLHQGIANRAFERKFNLADHVEVKGADLTNGLLTLSLLREIPEAMKPRSIPIGTGTVEPRSSDSANHNIEQNSAAAEVKIA